MQGDQQKLQQISGVCPQDDVLFPELTAREHLQLYAAFKGVAEVEAHCDEILRSVALSAHADNQISTFSGGMKRRLSVGIASVGGPRVLFLDEPTTGMDPLSRRRVWSTIEKLKLQRILLLTTHSMEEADALGDTIAILDNGKLRACGSSLLLKSRYGKGHTVSLLSKSTSSGRVTEIVKACIPAAEVMSSDAGNTAVSLPRAAMKGVPRLLASLMAENDLIDDWGISNTSLEEVFLRLCASNAVNATLEGTRIDRVMVVQRPIIEEAASGSQDNVLCVLETPHANDIIVISPEDTSTMETLLVPVEGGYYGEDSEGGSTAVAMDEGYLILGGGITPTGDRPISSTQLIEICIPPDALPGGQIPIHIGGNEVLIDIPSSAVPGERIEVCVPLPPPPNDDSNTWSAHLCAQVIAIAWKNLVLSCYCRKMPGRCGRLSPKCCELFCYLSIFLAMATVRTAPQLHPLLPVSAKHVHIPETNSCNLSQAATINLLIDEYKFGGASNDGRFCSNGIYSYIRLGDPCNYTVLAQSMLDDTSSRSTDSCVEMTANETCWRRIDLGGTCGTVMADIWFTNAGPGHTAFEDISPFPSASQALQFTTTFREVPIGGVYSRIMGAQSDVQTNRMGVHDTATNVTAFVRESFPSFALEISRSEFTSAYITFHWTVTYWLSQPGQRFRYTEVGSASSCVAGVPHHMIYHVNSYDRTETMVHDAISAMSNSILRTVAPGAGLSMSIVPMPELSFVVPHRQADTGVLWPLMYPLLTSLNLPSLAYMISLEREFGLLEMIQIAGGRLSAQLLGTWLFCFVYSAVFSSVFVLTMELSGASEDHQMTAGPVVLMIFSWAWAQTGFVMFLGLSCFTKAKYAAIIATLSVTVSSVCGVILTEILQFRLMALAGFLFPPLAYARTIGVLLRFGPSEEFVRGVAMLWLDGCMYTALTVAHVHWPTVRPLSSLRPLAATVDVDMVQEDESVSRERARVCGSDPAGISGSAVVITRLVKEFPTISNGTRKRTTKRAINELCLAIDKGETCEFSIPLSVAISSSWLLLLAS